MNINQLSLITTVTRSTSVVPVNGFGMGDVCPSAVRYSAGTSTLKRHADAVQATPVWGRTPWRPPVT
jgi:hypothetical protein